MTHNPVAPLLQRHHRALCVRDRAADRHAVGQYRTPAADAAIVCAGRAAFHSPHCDREHVCIALHITAALDV
jgi:hypothetical protein